MDEFVIGTGLITLGGILVGVVTNEMYHNRKENRANIRLQKLQQTIKPCMCISECQKITTEKEFRDYVAKCSVSC